MQLLLLKNKTEIGFYFQYINISSPDFSINYFPNEMFLLYKPLVIHSQIFIPLFKSSITTEKDYFQLYYDYLSQQKDYKKYTNEKFKEDTKFLEFKILFPEIFERPLNKYFK